MWRGAAARRFLSSKLLSPRAPANSHPNPVSSFDDALASWRAAASPGASRIHSADDPSVGTAVSFSSSSPAEAAVLGSLGSAVSRKGSDVTDAVRHYGRCYWELSKAKLSMLVVATSGAGFVLGSSSVIDLTGLCYTCVGTMMVAASASSLNQVFEIQNDAKMKRTRKRPLPSGRITAPHAALWASSVGIAGTSLLAWQANYLAAGLAACNLGLYAFVYTPLKQIHPVNTWVGAVVGAIPPLLGWAAASGEISLNAMILPAALYYWQLPHFMALAYLCRDDYIVGGFRMFSLADASGQRTALVSLRNCIYLLPLGFLAYNWGLTSKWFTLESSLLTLCMSIGAVMFVRERTAKSARRMFHGSLLYLPVFMAGLLLHRLPNDQQETMSSTEGLLISDPQEYEDESISHQKRQTRKASSFHARAPVAYASIAPFPFLPAPLYVSPDS